MPSVGGSSWKVLSQLINDPHDIRCYIIDLSITPIGPYPCCYTVGTRYA